MGIYVIKINLNNCATTKPKKEILDLYLKLAREYYYNSNDLASVSYEVNNLLNASILKIQKLLNFHGDIVFTTGATMSNNMIIQGFFKNNVNKCTCVISTQVEHPSIVNVIDNLPQNIEKINVEFDLNQNLDYEKIENILREKKCLISMCLVNNTTGLIIDYKHLYNLCLKYGSYLHLDVTQGLGKIPFDCNYAHFLSCSMHKINGLKGCGLILKQINTKLEPILFGGNSQSILFPGTTNVALFVTCSKTIQLALENFPQKYENAINLNSYLHQKLSNLAHIKLNSSGSNYSPYILNLSLKKHKSEVMLNYFEQVGILVSSGSACSSKVKTSNSKILQTYNFEYTTNSLRICLENNTSLEDIKEFIKIFKKGLEII